jgi:hypothetical protein
LWRYYYEFLDAEHHGFVINVGVDAMYRFRIMPDYIFHYSWSNGAAMQLGCEKVPEAMKRKRTESSYGATAIAVRVMRTFVGVLQVCQYEVKFIRQSRYVSPMFLKFCE